MPRSLNPKTERIQPIAVTKEEHDEIKRRAEFNTLTVAEFVRTAVRYPERIRFPPDSYAGGDPAPAHHPQPKKKRRGK